MKNNIPIYNCTLNQYFSSLSFFLFFFFYQQAWYIQFFIKYMKVLGLVLGQLVQCKKNKTSTSLQVLLYQTSRDYSLQLRHLIEKTSMPQWILILNCITIFYTNPGDVEEKTASPLHIYYVIN